MNQQMEVIIKEEKERIIKMINEGWYPDWQAAGRTEQLVKQVEELYALPVDSKEYYALKTTVLENIARNGLEEFSRGKYESGILTY